MLPAIAEGQQLYNQMNCVGCHFHGGGGMGVALMDGKWRYGGRIDQIAASIMRGPSERNAGVARPADRRADLAARRLCPHAVGPGAQGRHQRPRRRSSNTPPQTQTKREPLAPAESAEQ